MRAEAWLEVAHLCAPSYGGQPSRGLPSRSLRDADNRVRLRRSAVSTRQPLRASAMGPVRLPCPSCCAAWVVTTVPEAGVRSDAAVRSQIRYLRLMIFSFSACARRGPETCWHASQAPAFVASGSSRRHDTGGIAARANALLRQAHDEVGRRGGPAVGHRVERASELGYRHVLDAGHKLLETHAAAAASLMLDFIGHTKGERRTRGKCD
jgi:hypothetical protein